jgi:hypothetical protein
MAVDRSRKNQKNRKDRKDRKDPQLVRNEIKKRLKNALSDVERSGSFLTSDSFQIGINPGLEVSGAGPIGLPLSVEMAKRIIRHASPYQKGSKAPVDESVQKSWELNADQFFLRNPAWTEQIQKLLKAVVPGLGLKVDPKQVRGELSNLVVHEEGAFFLPHQDSKKADGMFGTLVVSLPSKHEGGDVVVSHKGKSRTFSSSPGSDFGFSYAAWYSDITHEVKPVTSGYRIVLTYNLIHRPSATLLERKSPSAMLIPLLGSWAALCKKVFPTLADQPVEWLGDEAACPTGLIYLLDRKHSQLSFTQFEGADQERVAELRKACEQTGFSIFLVNVEKSETGPVEDYGDGDSDDSYYDCCDEPRHYIYNVEESSLFLSEVVEPEDSFFAHEVDIDVGDAIFVQADPFDEPDEEDYSRHMEDYDEPRASHHYHRMVKKVSFKFPPPHFGRQMMLRLIVCFNSTDMLG